MEEKSTNINHLITKHNLVKVLKGESLKKAEILNGKEVRFTNKYTETNNVPDFIGRIVEVNGKNNLYVLNPTTSKFVDYFGDTGKKVTEGIVKESKLDQVLRAVEVNVDAVTFEAIKGQLPKKREKKEGNIIIIRNKNNIFTHVLAVFYSGKELLKNLDSHTIGELFNNKDELQNLIDPDNMEVKFSTYYKELLENYETLKIYSGKSVFPLDTASIWKCIRTEPGKVQFEELNIYKNIVKMYIDKQNNFIINLYRNDRARFDQAYAQAQKINKKTIEDVISSYGISINTLKKNENSSKLVTKQLDELKDEEEDEEEEEETIIED